MDSAGAEGDVGLGMGELPDGTTEVNTAIYVGGLDEQQVDLVVLESAFIPFGEIKEVKIPLDPVTKQPKGFGFVQYYHEDDAKAAIDNMDGAELYGKVLHVDLAKPHRTKLGSDKAVWSGEKNGGHQ